MSPQENPALAVLSANFADLGLFLDALLEIGPTLDSEQCVTILGQLADLATQTKGAVGTIEQRLLTLLDPGEVVSVPGSGQVIVETNGKKITKGAHLARVIAARVADTPCNADGEPLPPAVLCEKVADEMVIVFGLDNQSASFRSGELKKRDLRTGEFQEFLEGTPRVKFMAS